MRRKAIEALKAEGIPISEEFIRMSDIPLLDECFATNSSLKVYPVTKIDDTVISKQCGPITNSVITAVNRQIERESQPSASKHA